MITVKLPREVDERLTLLSLKTGRSRLFFAREAIVHHIKELEEKFYSGDKHDEDSRDNEDLNFDE